MAVVLQHRRMTTVNRMALVPLDGELIWDTTLSRLYCGNGSAAGGLSVREFNLPVYNTPVTGATITLDVDDEFLIIEPAGPLATLNIILPPTPYYGKRLGLTSLQDINVLTVTAPGGASVRAGAAQNLNADGSMEWIYRPTTWYRSQ